MDQAELHDDARDALNQVNPEVLWRGEVEEQRGLAGPSSGLKLYPIGLSTGAWVLPPTWALDPVPEVTYLGPRIDGTP